DRPRGQLSRQQPDVVSWQAHGSDGIGLLYGLDSDEVEAVEIAHRFHSARQDLTVFPVPRMTEVCPVEKQDESEMAIRDFVDEFAGPLVIDDDHWGFLRHEGRDPCIVEISWTSPLRHRSS